MIYFQTVAIIIHYCFYRSFLMKALYIIYNNKILW